jgi:hypothetical protein
VPAATFGEFLVARTIVLELGDLVRARNTPASQRWDDDRLFALLSHQLALRSGSAIISFAWQLVDQASHAEKAGLVDVLRLLVSRAEDRWGRGRYGDYDPCGYTYVQRQALYTANLVALLVTIAEPVDLRSIAPPGMDESEFRESANES